jgi:hypothetical protein
LFLDGDVLGLGTVDQLDPFHDSTNVWSTDPDSWTPTAMQVDEDRHATWYSALPAGTPSCAQLVPFQISLKDSSGSASV